MIGVRFINEALSGTGDSYNPGFGPVHEVRKGSQCTVLLTWPRDRHPRRWIRQARIDLGAHALAKPQSISGISWWGRRDMFIARRCVLHQLFAPDRILRKPTGCKNDPPGRKNLSRPLGCLYMGAHN